MLLNCLGIVGLALLSLLGLCTIAACLVGGQAERWRELARQRDSGGVERSFPAPGLRQQATTNVPATRRRSVLVVDDDALLRPLLQQLVSALDYEADAADTGQEALHRISGRDYDAILCDLMMPGMSGVDLFAACQRQHPQTARRFVFITAYPAGTPAVDAAANSGQPLLSKPCSYAAINAAIRQVA